MTFRHTLCKIYFLLKVSQANIADITKAISLCFISQYTYDAKIYWPGKFRRALPQNLFRRHFCSAKPFANCFLGFKQKIKLKIIHGLVVFVLYTYDCFVKCCEWLRGII